MLCWCSIAVLVFLLNLPFNLTAKYADLVIMLSGSLLLRSAFFIGLMSLSPLGPEQRNDKR